MGKLLSISLNTFTQVTRQPVYGIMIFVTLAVLVLLLPLSGYTMGESGGDYNETDQKALEETGISTLLMMVGVMLSSLCAGSAVSREIESRTALTVISKPVPRAVYVLGKFGGLAMAGTLAYYICLLGLLMVVRHEVTPYRSDPYDWAVIVLGTSALAATILMAVLGNYFFGWPFISAAVWCAAIFFSVAMGLIGFLGKNWQIVPFGQGIRPELMAGAALAFIGAMFMTAVATAASVRLDTVTTLIASLAVLWVGSFQPFFSVYADKVVLARLAHWVLPNLTYFYSMDVLSQPITVPIPIAYVVWAAVYGLVYLTAALAVGILLFQNRSLEGSEGGSGMPWTVAVLAGVGRIGALLALLLGLEGLLAVAVPAIRHGLTAAGWVSMRDWLTPATFRPVTSGWMGLNLVDGVLLWVFWGCFARGRQWSYWLAVTVFSLGLLASGGVLAVDVLDIRDLVSDRSPVALAALTCAVAVVFLVLPSTRRHFRAADRARQDRLEPAGSM